MQRRLLAELNLDLKKACELAQGMETANRNVKEIQSKDSEGLVHSIKGWSQKAPLQDVLGWVILLKIAGLELPNVTDVKKSRAYCQILQKQGIL